MPRFFANDSGTVREASRIFVNDNGTIREATMIWQLMGSTSRLVYTSGVPSFIASDILTSGTSASWSPRTGITYSRVHVWVIGAGGSGGASSTDSGREKNSNGGGAGGTAYRVFNRADITSGGTYTIGTGGAGVTVSGGGANSSGRSGGATTFIAGGITMRGNGGGSGSGGRNTVGEASTTPTSGAWGAVSAVSGGTASGGTANYTGGGQVANSIGGDGSRAVSGASTNLTGQTPANLNGVVISGGGFQQGLPGPRPSIPTFIDIQSLRTYFPRETFQGGAAQQHSSGGPVTGAVGSPYGAGGGSASAESSTANSGAGANGAVIILYEGRAEEIPPLNLANGFTYSEQNFQATFNASILRTGTQQFQTMVPNSGPNSSDTLVTPWSRQISNSDAVFFVNNWPEDGSAYAGWAPGVVVTNNDNFASDTVILTLYDLPTYNAGGGRQLNMVAPSTTDDEELWNTAVIRIRGATSGTEASLTLSRTDLNFSSASGSDIASGGSFIVPPQHQWVFDPTSELSSMFSPNVNTTGGFTIGETLTMALTIT